MGVSQWDWKSDQSLIDFNRADFNGGLDTDSDDNVEARSEVDTFSTTSSLPFLYIQSL